MPLINQLINSQAAAAIPSGQGNALDNGPAQAVNGISSSDLGATPIAGTPTSGGIAPAGPPPGYAPDLVHGGYAPIPGWTPASSGSTGGAASSSGGSAGAAAGPSGEGGPAGAPGDGSGGVGDGSGGVYKKGGFVAKGNPKSKTDDVSAKLQHGEFVIPREAVEHLAANAPDVLAHVVHVSAQHAFANRNAQGSQPSPAARLTGQNGMPPKPMHDGGPVGYRNGGLVVPAGVGPQLHPAVADAIRRAIAMHAATPVARPMVGPSQMAQMGPSIASQGRPPVLPPITGPAA